MFGKPKQEIEKINQGMEIQVMAIPDEFYGGKNPVVKFKTVEKEIAPLVKSIEKKVEKKNPPLPAPPTNQTNTQKVLTSRSGFVIASVVLFLLFVGSTALYYVWQSRKNTQPAGTNKKNNPAVSIQPTSTPVVTPTSSAVVVVSSSTIPAVVTSTLPSLGGGKIDFPSLLLGNGQDVDHDGLTDAEELTFSTDPELPDTDSDGYSDATEVNNLYSPTVKAPTRLIDTAAVKDYTNPQFGFKVYYPTNWLIGQVTNDGRDTLFTSENGENIEARVFDLASGETFEQWFAEWGGDEHLSSLLDFGSMFKVPGRERSDKLVYYFTDQSHVYVLVYHSLPNSNEVNYRNVAVMMGKSFRLASTTAALPVQPVVEIPELNTNTTTTTNNGGTGN